jgi:hypothetical protein
LSKKFLTPVNLPSGASLPSVGSIGDLFFKTTDQKVYTYTNAGWAASNSGGFLSELIDITITSPVAGDTLIYNETTNRWTNVNFAEMLLSFGLYSGEGGSYNTTEFTGTMDGGSYNTTLFASVVDGGNEGSF